MLYTSLRVKFMYDRIMLCYCTLTSCIFVHVTSLRVKFMYDRIMLCYCTLTSCIFVHVTSLRVKFMYDRIMLCCCTLTSCIFVHVTSLRVKFMYDRIMLCYCTLHYLNQEPGLERVLRALAQKASGGLANPSQCFQKPVVHMEEQNKADYHGSRCEDHNFL